MNFAGNFLLKVAQSPGCVRGLIRLHLSYCTMRTMFWLKELNFYFNQFRRGVNHFKPIKKEKFAPFANHTINGSVGGSINAQKYPEAQQQAWKIR